MANRARTRREVLKTSLTTVAGLAGPTSGGPVPQTGHTAAGGPEWSGKDNPWPFADRRCFSFLFEAKGTSELYDLQEDPWGLNNRYGQTVWAQPQHELEEQMLN
jgi:hypothetical protein